MTAALAKKSNKNAARSSIVVSKITQFMAKTNVLPLPRNYELFYEVLSGHNQAMGRDILALGNAPQQHDLDEIGIKYNLPGHCGITSGKAASEISKTIEQISIRLAAAMHRTNDLLSSSGIDTDAQATPEDLMQFAAELHQEQSSLLHFVTSGLETMRECEASIEKARNISLRDQLTTLPNRAAFAEKLSALFIDGQTQASCCVLVVNVDNFRFINEKYGAPAGNRALRRLAALFRKSIKKQDLVARTGGDEFAFLFNDVTLNAAENIADRLRRTVEALRFVNRAGQNETMTVSIGVTAVDGVHSPTEFYAQGELALLAARCREGNCVVPYSRDVAKRTRQSYLMQLGG
jgi:diguanylate cyclase